MAFLSHRMHGQLLLELREQGMALSAITLGGDQFLRQVALNVVADTQGFENRHAGISS
jgi:hypothetical protein